MASLNTLSCQPWSYSCMRYSKTMNPGGVGQIQRVFCSLDRASAFNGGQTWSGKNGAVKLDMNNTAYPHLSLQTS